MSRSTTTTTTTTTTVVVLLCIVVGSHAHVGLIYPPARRYALDFLDSARTVPPCGVPRGGGPTTDLKAGSTFTVSWHLGYAHDGGFRLELLTYDTVGNISKTYYLTSSTDAFVGANNVTIISYNVTLPQTMTCNNCTIRLVRQALNWGPNYLFWSCADVNILPASRFAPSSATCLGHGVYNALNSSCQCENTYNGPYCQFKDECNVDADCGFSGQCKRVTDYSYPQKQCFCQPGWFGPRCDKVSSVTSVQFNPSLYEHVMLSPITGVHLYYRIIQNSKELEVVLQAQTQSYLSLGWKPTNVICLPFSQRPNHNDEAVPEPVGPDQTTGTHPPTTTVRVVQTLRATTVPIVGPAGASTAPVPEPEVTGPADVNGMDCADIVIGSAIGKLSRVRDLYTRDRSTPREDEFYGGSQSLTAAIAEQTNDGLTTVIFRRPIDTRDNTDHVINNELMTVIWAHGQALSDTPNTGDFYRPDEIKYHSTHRGLTTLNFYKSGATPTAVTLNSDSWSTPAGCVPETCSYRAVWSFNQFTDTITFSITAKQPVNTWTGIAFAAERKMENMDAYIGFVDRSSRGVILDTWTSSLYSTPVRDSIQHVQQPSVSYLSGLLTMKFERQRDTRDSQDVKFSDVDCYYFMFPVGGGDHTDTAFAPHTSIPVVTPNKVCLKIGALPSVLNSSANVHGVSGILCVSLLILLYSLLVFVAADLQ